MGNHRIKLVTPGNSTLQFFRLTQNQPFGSYQRYLVGNTDNQFLLIERLRDEVIRANLKPFTISAVLFSAVRKMIGISAVFGFDFKC